MPAPDLPDASPSKMNRPGFVETPTPRKVGVVPAPRKYPAELRERAIRLVNEARVKDPILSLTAAVRRIAPRLGVLPDTPARLVQAGVGRHWAGAGDDDGRRSED
jgi:transposase-like protein